jgi:hypothetical protein
MNNEQKDQNLHVCQHSSNEMLAASLVSRCKRKFRPYEDLKIKSSGGMLDLFDNTIKEVYRITDAEYDYLAENLTDGEMSYFVAEKLSFSEKKQCLRIVQNHLSNYYAVSER